MNQEIIKELDKILPVVARVHGDNHPELKDVLALYLEAKEAPSAVVFSKIREITSDYAIPEDACPTYEKAFADLKELEKSI